MPRIIDQSGVKEAFAAHRRHYTPWRSTGRKIAVADALEKRNDFSAYCAVCGVHKVITMEEMAAFPRRDDATLDDIERRLKCKKPGARCRVELHLRLRNPPCADGYNT